MREEFLEFCASNYHHTKESSWIYNLWAVEKEDHRSFSIAADFENSVLPYTWSSRNFCKNSVPSLNNTGSEFDVEAVETETGCKGLNVLDLLNNSKKCTSIA